MREQQLVGVPRGHLHIGDVWGHTEVALCEGMDMSGRREDWYVHKSPRTRGALSCRKGHVVCQVVG